MIIYVIYIINAICCNSTNYSFHRQNVPNDQILRDKDLKFPKIKIYLKNDLILFS